jgi:thimet oligopeptidase
MIVTSNILALLLGGMLPDIGAAAKLLPCDVVAAETMVTQSLADAAELKKELLAIPSHERTYVNTVMAYDRFDQLLGVVDCLVSEFSYLSDDVKNRNIPNDRFCSAAILLRADKNFFRAFQEYEHYGMAKEILTAEQQYYFKKVMRSFVSQGYSLNSELFEKVKQLREKEEALVCCFTNAINADRSFVVVDESMLTGVDPEFIAAQERDEDAKIKLYCNAFVAAKVLKYCSNRVVRKTLFEGLQRRAYPENVITLESLIAVRDERAQLLGFDDYNSLCLHNSMIKTPENAYTFLDFLEQSARVARANGIAAVKKCIPSDVILDTGDTILQEDIGYIITEYEKTVFSLDDQLIAEYFSAQKTITGMLAIYEKFMNVEFEYTDKVAGAWHDTVAGVTVYTKGRSAILGYILLDLYSRPYKYSHACCFNTMPRTVSRPEQPGVAIIITNFPEAIDTQPILVNHDTVRILFHEFGHAMHGILSATEHYGSRVWTSQHDFLELPSQLLEFWIWDRDILKLISCHYKTGESLPDELIDKMLAAHKFESGFYCLSRLFLSRYSLDCFSTGNHKDTTQLLFALFRKHFPEIVINQNYRMQAFFRHLALSGYGPFYYGYELSQAYAYEVFAVIKKHGLLNPEIGKRYVNCILKPGASKDASELLRDFLGRPVSADAYVAWLRSLSQSDETQ